MKIDQEPEIWIYKNKSKYLKEKVLRHDFVNSKLVKPLCSLWSHLKTIRQKSAFSKNISLKQKFSSILLEKKYPFIPVLVINYI